jgi:hypothetical protein
LALLALTAVTGACGIFAPHPGSGGPPAGPLPAPRVTAGDLDPRLVLGELPARALRLGAGAPSLVTSAVAIENEWTGGFVDVPRDDCLLGYARGASSIDDIDVAVFSDEGTQLAVDEGRDVHPTVLLCAPHPDRVYVAAHVVEGEGLVVVGAQLVPKERALIVGRALGAHGAIGDGPAPAEAWPGLEDAVRAHRDTLGGPWEEFKRIALAVDARAPSYVPLPLQADQCVDAVIVPDDEAAFLDVEALDAEGRVVARAREGTSERTLTLCSPLAMAGTLTLRPHVGRGRAAVVLARARADVARGLVERPEVAWAAAPLPVEAARNARNALLAKSGYDAPTVAATGSLLLGRRVSMPVDLRAVGRSSCARVDVVAGTPMALFDARIWDDAGVLLASGEASSSVALFACARSSARLELETRGRPGPYAITVRPERWRDAAFAAHPLAASRMLARAATGPESLFEGKESAARDQPLDASRVTAWTESLRPGYCVRVAVGAQGEGAGVELRAYEADTGSEIDRSEGAHGASVRACAPADAPRAVRFDLQASAGHMEAVVGELVSGKD